LGLRNAVVLKRCIAGFALNARREDARTLEKPQAYLFLKSGEPSIILFGFGLFKYKKYAKYYKNMLNQQYQQVS
jgi:hypothetical protein